MRSKMHKVRYQGHWERKANAEPVTYIVEAEGTGRVRIGRTTHIAERLKDMQSRRDQKLVLLRKIKGFHHQPYLHKCLIEDWIQGQWYRKTDELVEFLNHYRRDDEFFQPVDHRPVKISTLD